MQATRGTTGTSRTSSTGTCSHPAVPGAHGVAAVAVNSVGDEAGGVTRLGQGGQVLAEALLACQPGHGASGSSAEVADVMPATNGWDRPLVGRKFPGRASPARGGDSPLPPPGRAVPGGACGSLWLPSIHTGRQAGRQAAHKKACMLELT